jgi:hypothetical protein
MAIAKIPLVEAARKVHSDPSVFRRVLNRFGLVDRQQDGQRVVDPRVVQLMQRTKAASGYLVPVWIRTRDDLLAAAAEIPVSEINDRAEAP